MSALDKIFYKYSPHCYNNGLDLKLVSPCIALHISTPDI